MSRAVPGTALRFTVFAGNPRIASGKTLKGEALMHRHQRKVRPFGFSVVVSLCLMVGLFSQSGCAVFMAAKQPPKKDLSVLSVGAPRSLLLAELGQPVSTDTKDGKRVDLFSFTQGYSKGAKTGRALFHGAADVMTLGLWEVVGTPTEVVFSGKKMSFEVTYDAKDRVEKISDISKQEQ